MAPYILFSQMDFPPHEIQTLVGKISSLLIARNETISVAEAACGGLLSAYLISIPGASKFFHGGTLIYSLKSRLKLSGWESQDILNYTGPSEQVVLRLARNLRIELGSTYVLSESGFAGPSLQIEGSTYGDELEIGTVFLGISGPSGDRSQKCMTECGDRSKNMQLFARLGLEFLLKELEERSKGGEK